MKLFLQPVQVFFKQKHFFFIHDVEAVWYYYAIYPDYVIKGYVKLQ